MKASIVALSEPAALDPQVVGHKAANLAKLTSQGFAVPQGSVITRDGCRAILEANGLGGSATPEQILTAKLPDEIRQAFNDGLAAWGPVAVRSSGLAEDLPGASFAGQYESVLGVHGDEAFQAAVLQVIASAFDARVASYNGGPAPMAVLVQEMVPADAAGVAFTANPVTGDRETLVSAVRGLGERLVGGEATPDEWVVRDGGAEQLSSPEGAIGRSQVLEIAELAASVESAAGGAPIDIEWAIADGELRLLQARPITALPRRPDFVVPSDGYWMKDDTHYPMPLTPFGASVYLPALTAGMKPMFDTFGFLVEGVEQISLGGEAYIRMIPLGGKDRKAPPWWVMWVAARLAPPIRKRAKVAREVAATGLFEQLIDRWYSEWRDSLRLDCERLLERDLASLDDAQLNEHIDEALALLQRGEDIHFVLWISYAKAMYDLHRTCEEQFGWEPAKTMALVSGTSAASSAPGRALAALAAQVAASSEGTAAVRQGGSDVLARLGAVAPDVAQAVRRYLDEHGHRTLSYDPGDPTLAERPELLAGLLADRISGISGGDVHAAERAAEQAAAEARSALASDEQLALFEERLAVARRAYPVREDNIVWTDNVPSAIIHYAGLEYGRRLAESGVLAAAEDAMFLELEELRTSLADPSKDQRPTVDRRRAERAWVAAHPGPSSYGPDPGPPPDLRGLQPELRELMEGLLWMMSLMILPEKADVPEGALAGVAGSPGRHTGTVRVIRDESEFDRLRPGDVLVCPITSPAWSVLFSQAGAVVTDGGGVLAHAAVIAREYGVPAVLATGSGTSQLRDGETVTVDGTKGCVVRG